MGSPTSVGQEIRKLDPRTEPESPLVELLICGSCGGLLTLDKGREGRGPRYICWQGPAAGRSRCSAPELDSATLDVLVIGAILRSILTVRNAATVLESANEPRPGGGPQPRVLTGGDLRKLVEYPQLFVRAVGGAATARDFLGRFIAKVEVHPERAVISYSMPLPGDSSLPGRRRQEIVLPPEVVA